MKPYISFLLPIRKRVEALKSSLDSLVNTCSDINNFEVIIVFDSDDVETIQAFNSWNKNFNYKTIITERFGYNYLNEYYNLAALSSLGDWIWVWNDDTQMISKNWDIIIKEYDKQFVILNPYNTREVDREYLNTHTLFPILPKEYINLFNRLSPWNHIDTYTEHVISGLNLLKNEFRIIHTHEKEKYLNPEVVYHMIPIPTNEIEIDRNKLIKYLNERN